MFWSDCWMVYRIIIVGEALQGKEIGIEDVIVIGTGQSSLLVNVLLLRMNWCRYESCHLNSFPGTSFYLLLGCSWLCLCMYILKKLYVYFHYSIKSHLWYTTASYSKVQWSCQVSLHWQCAVEKYDGSNNYVELVYVSCYHDHIYFIFIQDLDFRFLNKCLIISLPIFLIRG